MSNDVKFFLLDTNCVLYLMKGSKELASLTNNNKLATNFIIEVELSGWQNITSHDKKLIKKYFDNVYYFDYNSRIKDLAITLKQKHNLKLADSFIAATAIYHELTLVSAYEIFSKISELSFIQIIP